MAARRGATAVIQQVHMSLDGQLPAGKGIVLNIIIRTIVVFRYCHVWCWLSMYTSAFRVIDRYGVAATYQRTYTLVSDATIKCDDSKNAWQQLIGIRRIDSK